MSDPYRAISKRQVAATSPVARVTWVGCRRVIGDDRWLITWLISYSAGETAMFCRENRRARSCRISSDRAPDDQTWASGNNNAQHVSDDCVTPNKQRLHASLVSVLCTCVRFVFRFYDYNTIHDSYYFSFFNFDTHLVTHVVWPRQPEVLPYIYSIKNQYTNLLPLAEIADSYTHLTLPTNREV